MKKKEVQPKMDMTPVWEEKGFHFRAMVLGPFLFLGYCIVISSSMALLLKTLQFLTETFCLRTSSKISGVSLISLALASALAR